MANEYRGNCVRISQINAEWLNKNILSFSFRLLPLGVIEEGYNACGTK